MLRLDISTLSQKRLYYWYLILYAQVAQHQLLHPDYAKEHAPHANKAITELLLTDLGCAGFPAGEKPIFRAWILRLFGTMYLQDALALKSARSRASLEVTLDIASRATNLALKMVRGKAEKQLLEKRSQAEVPLLQRLVFPA